MYRDALLLLSTLLHLVNGSALIRGSENLYAVLALVADIVAAYPDLGQSDLGLSELDTALSESMACQQAPKSNRQVDGPSPPWT